MGSHVGGKQMAQILSFRTPELRSGTVTSRHEQRSAEVILFPGVRYERRADHDASRGVCNATPRDVIELADQ